jgi:hypothetical protein
MSISQHILTNAVLYCTIVTRKPKSKRKIVIKCATFILTLLPVIVALVVAQDVSIR